jgi:hypothetical protein
MATSVSRKTQDLANTYFDFVGSATESLSSRWKSNEYYMTFSQAAVYPLYFRNSSIWDSMTVLLSRDMYIGAEFLIRPLFEGVTKFDWCMLDVELHAWRFRLTTMESTSEYYNSHPAFISEERISNLREAIASLKEKRIQRMPPMRQICEEIACIHGDKWHGFYKYFSKIVHAEFEDWGRYDVSSRGAGQVDGIRPSLEETINCKSMATYLQMRNIILMGMLFEPMKYDAVDKLEDIWSLLFYSLLNDEQGKKS